MTSLRTSAASGTRRPLAMFTQDRIHCPLGPLLAVYCGPALVGLDFIDAGRDGDGQSGRVRLAKLLARTSGPLDLGDDQVVPACDATIGRQLRVALAEYFAGRLTALDAIDVQTAGTPFQERSWAALRAIAPGQVISYAEQARRIGSPKAVRAVGLANARNALAIVIPCHRVIGAHRALTGYAGGVARKRWLLEHEGVRL